MDDAERWLLENDAEYGLESESWRDVKSGTYKPASRERRSVERAGDESAASSMRACEEATCGQAFYPMKVGHRFCSELCGKRARRRKLRADRWHECERCSTGFYSSTPWHRFCSTGCRVRAYRARRAA